MVYLRVCCSLRLIPIAITIIIDNINVINIITIECVIKHLFAIKNQRFIVNITKSGLTYELSTNKIDLKFSIIFIRERLTKILMAIIVVNILKIVTGGCPISKNTYPIGSNDNSRIIPVI